MINIKDFSKLDIRTGTVLKAEILKGAKKPAYILEIDFGKLGIKKSSAQITDLYSVDGIIGRKIIAVVNMEPKRIAGFDSEVLVLGASDDNGRVVLLNAKDDIPNGSKVG